MNKARRRTSHSDPLLIDELVTPGGGRLGLTLCPGKQQDDAVSGAWRRDLDVDLDAIRAWGAGTLVCLVEQHELQALGVTRLPAACRERGIVFRHLPIADYHAPDAGFEDHWLYHGEHLRQALRDGARVLLHCKGGLGRTGTIAARLLVELGTTPDEAIRQVRTVRPGSIETAAQEAYVRACEAPRAELGRMLGSLLGGAVGDAFGYTVEFLHLEDIRARFGEAGLRAPMPVDGRLIVSDDTQMTLFTLEGLAAALHADADIDGIIERVRIAYLDWLRTQHAGASSPASGGSLVNEPALQAGRAPGSTCLAALHAGGNGSDTQPINNSKGCGGLMRVAPLGFLPTRFDTSTAATLGLRAAALTHGHPSGYLAAAVMSAAVRELVAGSDLPLALDRAAQTIRMRENAGETLEALAGARRAAASRGSDHGAAIARLGQGWVAEEALAIGVYAALTGNHFAEVLAIAANHDGDSDSTASVAGQLYGAWRGLATLPDEWVMQLDVLNPALRTLGALLAADARRRNENSGNASDQLERVPRQ